MVKDTWQMKCLHKKQGYYEAGTQDNSGVSLITLYTYGEMIKSRAGKVTWHIVEGLEHLAEECVLNSASSEKLVKILSKDTVMMRARDVL